MESCSSVQLLRYVQVAYKWVWVVGEGLAPRGAGRQTVAVVIMRLMAEYRELSRLADCSVVESIRRTCKVLVVSCARNNFWVTG